MKDIFEKKKKLRNILKIIYLKNITWLILLFSEKKSPFKRKK